ncbi:low specificity L-threonine aldolase [Neisseria sp. 83E34]|uniref:threonine aldolase family protein n=1 Tax=Neisseria sp. 83E34 TaxID=1692264 RepID=UPI0006CE82B5|nr:low specificity L-threonine aldolase [Neisseria sp. 83E34]KPN70760.1 threonine aldolase [Neisseria sp. 83E34]
MKVLHDSNKISFASDNYSGVHPEIMQALAAANGGHVGAYGNDVYTERLQAVIKQHFGEQAQAWPVWNGTGANVLALQALLPRWGGVICAENAHINADESTAPQSVGGFKLWTVASSNGKLSPELIDTQAWGYGFEHRAQPLVVSITQTTEFGTCYTADEIRKISQHVHSLGMKLHMDGARLANAAAHLGVSLHEITTDAGVDILSLGGTKNGLMFGECIVLCNPEAIDGNALKYLRKLNLQLASKMRFLSAQFIALLGNDLWLNSAKQANMMALRLLNGLQNIDGIKICQPVESNAIFVKLPEGVADKVRKHYDFYDWDNDGTVRLMCSFDTQESHVDEFVQVVTQALVLMPV